MKNIFIKTAAVIMSVVLLMSLSSCFIFELPGEADGKIDEITPEYAYDLAKQAGYTGSLAEFMEAIKGEQGEKGDKGDDGTPGTDGASGKDGEAGKDGKDGDDGVGISSVEVNENGHLIITYTDGTSHDAGEVTSTGDIYVTPSSSDRAVNEAILSSVSVWANATGNMYSTGSGIIYELDKSRGDAYIITNHHVIYDDSASAVSDNIMVFLYGQEGYTDYAINAELVGATADFDIAVLKITGSELLKSSSARQITIADSDKAAAYDEVIAIGNPMSDGIAVNAGRISVDNEPVKKTGVSGSEINVYMMRFDAAVNEGNSGGGLFTDTGAYIGTVTLKQIGEKIDNIAYAVPSNLVISLAEKMIKNCEEDGYAYAIKPMFGIQFKAYEAYSVYDEVTGALTKVEHGIVDSVVEGSAVHGILLAGDKLVSGYIGGTEYIFDRMHKIVEFAIDVDLADTVCFKIMRGDTELILEIPLTSADFVEIK